MKTSSPTYSPKSPPILDIQDLYISISYRNLIWYRQERRGKGALNFRIRNKPRINRRNIAIFPKIKISVQQHKPAPKHTRIWDRIAKN